MLKKINTNRAPAAIGPYSQAIIAGDFLYVSGQIPINPNSGEIEGNTITEQTEQVMKNIEEILKVAGISFNEAVKTACFLEIGRAHV